LEGPLQSWGVEDRFNFRKTGLLPSKSAILGLCCAALGAPRGSQLEQASLNLLNQLQFLVVALPQRGDQTLAVRRMEDFHTVQNTRTADGKPKDTHITHRTYLNDASFAAFLTGDSALLSELASAIKDPVWGLWLGRKACLPSAPVFHSLHETEEAALSVVLGGRPLAEYTRQRDAASFTEGTDTINDSPATFGSPRRFLPRRVKLRRAGESE
jgi:CRISPR system Cascade subunit CasD